MIEGRSVQPETVERPRPSLVDGRLQEVWAEPAANEIGDQAKIAEFSFARRRRIELEKSGRHAAYIQHKDLDRRLSEEGGECRVVKQPPLEPQPRPANH